MELEKLVTPFGLEISSVKKLEGYISTNFKITTPDEEKYVLKVYKNPKERNEVLAENQIMAALAKCEAFEISTPIFTQSGDSLQDFPDGSFSRVMTYIEGQFLGEATQDNELLHSFGRQIAKIDKALSFLSSAEISSKRMSWDLANALSNLPKVEFIQDPADKKLVDYYFDQFEHFVVPKIPSSRSQLIHGDLNDWNVLVKKNQVSGFIDFGDMVHAPLINDLAIALCYIMMNKEHPIASAIQVIEGFVEEYPLLESEVELLPILIPTRLCVSVCHSAEAKSKASDTEYILMSERPAWELLKKWISWSPLQIKNAFLKAAKLPMLDPKKEMQIIRESRKSSFGPSLGLSYKSPIFMSSAAFQYMHDKQGNTYLDAYNNIPHIGHCHPAVSRAVSKQIRSLYTNTRYHNQSLGAYAEKLLNRFPEQLSKVFFVNSGSEANDLAIRMANTFTKRQHQLVLELGYHGNSQTTIDISSYKYNGKGGSGKANYIHELPLPKLYKGKFSTTAEYVEDAISAIQKAQENGKSFSAFIAEPISGCGGQVPLAKHYLMQMYSFLKQQGIVCIMDEVQTGFGRLGDWFWGFEFHGVVPDIVVLGKPMGNGFPIAAVVTSDEIANSFANGMEFFSSFGGNPLATEAANAVLDVIEKEALDKHAGLAGRYFKNQLNALRQRYPTIGDVRGEGLFLGIEFIEPTTAMPGTQIANIVKNELKEHYILSGTDGKFEQVLKIKPPLCFNTQNADQFCETLELILRQIDEKKGGYE